MNNNRRIGRPVGVAALAIVVTAALPVKADPVADFYRGKNIILNVGTSPGSGADIAARMVARNLTRHIPGQPNVVVRNMSGGGGLLIFNHLYNKAPKDGTEFSTVVQFPFEYLFDTGSTKALFDASKFRWIGGPVNFAAVAVAWNASTKIRKAEDLLTQELVIGASAVASNSATDAYVTRNILGFKYKVVLGYAGGAELDIAMIRGETQGRAQLSWPAIKQRNPEWVADNQISILYQMGLQKSPDIPAHVPLILDFAKNPADRQVLELKFASYSMGYPIFGPPGIPADRLAAMRKALMATLNDPITRADAAKLRIDVAPITGEAIEETIAKAHAAPRAIVDRLLEASKPPN
jgi:tripartite-type tricarboxylate transporter receptor subunit TctC